MAQQENIEVLKFGGSSLADVEKLKRVAEYIQEKVETGKKVAVVVSAMGSKTDDLISLNREICQNSASAPEETDKLLVTGEMQSAALLARVLVGLGLHARSLNGVELGLEIDSTYRTINRIRNVDIITEFFKTYDVLVITGFQGVMQGTENRFITIGRGGSDLTAIVLSSVLGLKQCFIYTDVDGFYAVDPRVVPMAKRFNKITFEQALSLTQTGVGVLMDRCVSLAYKLGIEIKLMLSPSLGSSTGGTLIFSGSSLEEIEYPLHRAHQNGLAVQKLGLIKVSNIPNVPGMASKIFEAIQYINIIDSDQSLGEKTAEISILYLPDDSEKVMSSLERLKQAEQALSEINIVNSIKVVGLTLVSLVMRYTPGYLYRTFKVMAEGKINIEMYSSSGNTILVVVKEEYLQEASEALGKEFNLVS